MLVNMYYCREAACLAPKKLCAFLVTLSRREKLGEIFPEETQLRELFLHVIDIDLSKLVDSVYFHVSLLAGKQQRIMSVIYSMGGALVFILPLLHHIRVLTCT